MWPPAPRGRIGPLCLTGLGFQGPIDSHCQDLFCHQLTAGLQTYITDVTGLWVKTPRGIPQRIPFKIRRKEKSMSPATARRKVIFAPQDEATAQQQWDVIGHQSTCILKPSVKVFKWKRLYCPTPHFISNLNKMLLWLCASNQKRKCIPHVVVFSITPCVFAHLFWPVLNIPLSGAHWQTVSHLCWLLLIPTSHNTTGGCGCEHIVAIFHFFLSNLIAKWERSSLRVCTKAKDSVCKQFNHSLCFLGN